MTKVYGYVENDLYLIDSIDNINYKLLIEYQYGIDKDCIAYKELKSGSYRDCILSLYGLMTSYILRGGKDTYRANMILDELNKEIEKIKAV